MLEGRRVEGSKGRRVGELEGWGAEGSGLEGKGLRVEGRGFEGSEG